MQKWVHMRTQTGDNNLMDSAGYRPTVTHRGKTGYVKCCFAGWIGKMCLFVLEDLSIFLSITHPHFIHADNTPYLAYIYDVLYLTANHRSHQFPVFNVCGYPFHIPIYIWKLQSSDKTLAPITLS